MYTSFFGLTEKPFTITPDPRYLFMSERHSEALAHLVYGVTESDGFIQLTGEVGTGKTTLVRSLLQKLPKRTEVAVVLNPQLTAREFLVAICRELGIPQPEERDSLRALVDALNENLLAAHADDRRTILVVDEAQNLAAEVLEQVRLLTNLETTRQKLLQIILIGQPELRELLARNDLRQLAQRITARYHLEPLDRNETIRYIEHRLKVAGAVTDLFTPAAKREVYRLSGGVPRLVNVICDRSLLGAYSRERRQVDKTLVRRAAAEISGQRENPFWQRWLVPLAGTAALATLAFSAWYYLAPTDDQPPARPVVRMIGPPGAAAGPAGAAPSPITAAEASSQPRPTQAAQPSPEDGMAAGESGRNAPAESGIGSDPDPSLAAILRDNPQATDSVRAFATLFDIWTAGYDPEAGAACDQAGRQGLQCLFQRGTWNTLRQFDRPAILTLTNEDAADHRVVLASLNDETGVILLGGQRYELPLSEIGDYWYGDFVLLWRPPFGDVVAYQYGMRGDGVRWLRRSLSEIQGRPFDDGDSEYFDRDLEQRLREYQRSQRLRVDGIAGQQTQILINSDLGLAQTPRLTVSG
ncbi:ExeA family protein [Lentisalinibacter sediminis]|uniref:ExeA family protein n=1 Tax=Lentisalinibacter sediminis TaxID=2992237 RepID=UPI00386AFED1